MMLYCNPKLSMMLYCWIGIVSMTSLVMRTSATVNEATIAEAKLRSMFENWLRRYGGHHYDSMVPSNIRGSEEYFHRLSIFETNYHKINKHNQAFKKGYTSYRMTLDNEFAIFTDDEFTSLYLMESQNCSATTHTSSGTLQLRDPTEAVPADDTPPAIDWRTKGVITPIKNQKHCGSCWTFSTTGCLEAHTCIQAKADGYNKKDCTSWTGLAEQQLVDCAQDFNNHGCNGGLPSQAFEYIKYNGGIDYETSYKYEANETGLCQASLGKVGGQVAEVFNITSGDEDDLIYAVGAVGPVSIAYQVSPDFRHYEHGVYDSFNATTNSTMCQNGSQDVNHAVVAVGLGVTEPSFDKDTNRTIPAQPYYIVRNSWGTSWGMEGYFWMLRNANLCGVSDCASFPLVPKTAAAGTTTSVTTSKTKNRMVQDAMESASSIL